MSRKPKKTHDVEKLYPEAFLMARNIETLRNYYRISNEEISEAMGKSRSTLTRRYKQPWDFRSGEIKSIAKLLHTTVDDLCTADISGKIDGILSQEV